MIGQIIFDSGGLGANRKVSGKLGMKLAIICFRYLLGLGEVSTYLLGKLIYLRDYNLF